MTAFGHIDDREPALPQRDGSRVGQPEPFVIGTAVSNRIGHPTYEFNRIGYWPRTDNPGDPTHVVEPTRIHIFELRQ